MSPEERQEFEDLQSRVEELESYVEARQFQQLEWPLDQTSRDILNETYLQ